MNDLPNLPNDAALSQTAGVPEGWTRDVADAAAALDKRGDRQMAARLMRLHRDMHAAAPAASGGVDYDEVWLLLKSAQTNIGARRPDWDADDAEHWDRLTAAMESVKAASIKQPGSINRPLVSDDSQNAAASVSERARELLAAEYRTHGWHEDAGRLCMGGDPTSFVEDDALRVIDRLIEQGDEDNHVITELGRLLAGIAVILKGPEPAGTAWSYHDLPELVASSLSEPRQVAAEMKAWAHTKMAEQQSSRRDRMMVAEWAKRLLPESSFPIKDFDVEGMSITKEAAREAVKRVALEQALTQRRGESSVRIEDLGIIAPMRHPERADAEQAYSITAHDFEKNPIGSRDWTIYWRGWWHRSQLYTTPQPSADAVRELVAKWREDAEIADRNTEGNSYASCADELESLLSAASGEKGVG